MSEDGLETLCRNAAAAAASGFTTYTAALWFQTGAPEPLFLVACLAVWVLVTTTFRSQGSPR